MGPEVVVTLNHSGAAIVRLCDGEHSVCEILQQLAETYDDVSFDDVRTFVSDLCARNLTSLR